MDNKLFRAIARVDEWIAKHQARIIATAALYFGVHIFIYLISK